MVKDFELDNLNGQEIKEMIKRNNIALNQLNTSALRKLMDYETDMLCYGEGDIELITQCSDLLDQAEAPLMSDEEFMNIVHRSKSENVTVADNEKAPKAKPKFRKILKRAIIAAVAAALLASGTIAATGSLDGTMARYFREALNYPRGTWVEVDGHSVIINDVPTYYYSVEELMENVDVDIMYPTKWPQGNELRAITVDKDITEISFRTNEHFIYFDVNLNVPYPDNADTRFAHNEHYVYNGITYYISVFDITTVYWYTGGHEYHFGVRSREDAIFMIENMKEFKNEKDN